MKTLKAMSLLVVFVALFLIGCNHDSPVVVTDLEDQGYVDLRAYTDPGNDAMDILQVRVPSFWCRTPDNIIAPWFFCCIDGNYREVYLTDADVQAVEPGFKEYYTLRIWVSKGAQHQISFIFGNYIDRNDVTNRIQASLAKKNDPYILPYQPNDNANNQTYVIGFNYRDGNFWKINPSDIVPMGAAISIDGTPSAGKAAHFSATNIRYSGVIGLAKYQWVFSDNRTFEGQDIYPTFYGSGNKSVKLRLVDNYGNVQEISRGFTVY